MIFLFAKDYRTVASGWQAGTVFQELGPGAGLKAGDFIKEKGGGTTVERLNERAPQPSFTRNVRKLFFFCATR